MITSIDAPKNEYVQEFCHVNNWRYFVGPEVTGIEDQCIILYECTPGFELISRARNQLIFVSTQKYVLELFTGLKRPSVQQAAP